MKPTCRVSASCRDQVICSIQQVKVSKQSVGTNDFLFCLTFKGLAESAEPPHPSDRDEEWLESMNVKYPLLFWVFISSLDNKSGRVILYR